MSKALFIPAGEVSGTPEEGGGVHVQIVELPETMEEELSALQHYCEGYVETIEFAAPNGEMLLMWINEEGKLNGMVRNAVASRLVGQTIAGPVVVTGEESPDGSMTTLTQETILTLFGHPLMVASQEEEEAGPFVIVNMGWADGRDLPEKGAFLRSFDPNANDGRGDVVWTTDLRDARAFLAKEDAWAEWNQVSTTRPMRPDGKPNKPLTAWNILVVPSSDYENGPAVRYMHIPEDGDHRRQAFRWN
jgi:hypothetical protein